MIVGDEPVNVKVVQEHLRLPVIEPLQKFSPDDCGATES
jgi:hypothetical protein